MRADLPLPISNAHKLVHNYLPFTTQGNTRQAGHQDVGSLSTLAELDPLAVVSGPSRGSMESCHY